MTCAEVKAKLSAYQDNEVDQDIHRQIQKHLQVCLSCQHEWQQIQQIWLQVKGITEVEPAPQFTALVMEEIRLKEKQRFRFIPSFVYSFVFVLFFLLGFAFFSSNGNGKQPRGEMAITQLLVESQNLDLINIQDPTLDLVAYGGNPRGR